MTLSRTASNGAELSISAQESPGNWSMQFVNFTGAQLCEGSTPMGKLVSQPLAETASVGQAFNVTSTNPNPSGNAPAAPTITVNLCWKSNGPISVDGAYLSAQLPELILSDGEEGVLETPPYGDPAPCDSSSTEVGNTIPVNTTLLPDTVNISNYSVQSIPDPTLFNTSNWGWEQWVPAPPNDDTARGGASCGVFFSAIDATTLQSENARVITGGVLLGIAGIAVVGILQQLLEPMTLRRRERWRREAVSEATQGKGPTDEDGSGGS